MNSTTEQLYYTPTKAARHLGISVRTIYNWMEKNQLPYHTTPSGRRLILIADALTYKWEKKNNEDN